MAQTTAATRTSGTTNIGGESTDIAESMLRTIDVSTKDATGISLFHILTFASIGASIALFASGRKMTGIFVGLWPPTFQALKAVADTNKEDKKR